MNRFTLNCQPDPYVEGRQRGDEWAKDADDNQQQGFFKTAPRLIVESNLPTPTRSRRLAVGILGEPENNIAAADQFWQRFAKNVDLTNPASEKRFLSGFITGAVEAFNAIYAGMTDEASPFMLGHEAGVRYARRVDPYSDEAVSMAAAVCTTLERIDDADLSFAYELLAAASNNAGPQAGPRTAAEFWAVIAPGVPSGVISTGDFLSGFITKVHVEMTGKLAKEERGEPDPPFLGGGPSSN